MKQKQRKYQILYFFKFSLHYNLTHTYIYIYFYNRIYALNVHKVNNINIIIINQELCFNQINTFQILLNLFYRERERERERIKRFNIS